MRENEEKKHKELNMWTDSYKIIFNMTHPTLTDFLWCDLTSEAYQYSLDLSTRA